MLKKILQIYFILFLLFNPFSLSADTVQENVEALTTREGISEVLQDVFGFEDIVNIFNGGSQPNSNYDEGDLEVTNPDYDISPEMSSTAEKEEYEFRPYEGGEGGNPIAGNLFYNYVKERSPRFVRPGSEEEAEEEESYASTYNVGKFSGLDTGSASFSKPDTPWENVPTKKDQGSEEAERETKSAKDVTEPTEEDTLNLPNSTDERVKSSHSNEAIKENNIFTKSQDNLYFTAISQLDPSISEGLKKAKDSAFQRLIAVSTAEQSFLTRLAYDNSLESETLRRQYYGCIDDHIKYNEYVTNRLQAIEICLGDQLKVPERDEVPEEEQSEEDKEKERGMKPENDKLNPEKAKSQEKADENKSKSSEERKKDTTLVQLLFEPPKIEEYEGFVDPGLISGGLFGGGSFDFIKDIQEQAYKEDKFKFISSWIELYGDVITTYGPEKDDEGKEKKSGIKMVKSTIRPLILSLEDLERIFLEGDVKGGYEEAQEKPENKTHNITTIYDAMVTTRFNELISLMYGKCKSLKEGYGVSDPDTENILETDYRDFWVYKANTFAMRNLSIPAVSFTPTMGDELFGLYQTKLLKDKEIDCEPLNPEVYHADAKADKKYTSTPPYSSLFYGYKNYASFVAYHQLLYTFKESAYIVKKLSKGQVKIKEEALKLIAQAAEVDSLSDIDLKIADNLSRFAKFLKQYSLLSSRGKKGKGLKSK